jgi:RNA polymerase sigma-70 factor (ECF subfamily)
MSERDIDQQLVERVQRGDQQAFTLLVGKYQRKIERLVARMVRDPDEVLDITQEAFIKAYRALPKFRGESAFYTWLYRIAVNSAKNYLATLSRRPRAASGQNQQNPDSHETFEDDENLSDINTPESVLMSKQVAETVNRAVEDLPQDLRRAITLREIEGMSYEEIALIMRCPIGTVRSRIFRAREAIAERLRPLLDISKDKRW